jgi:hypothetical protein
MFNKARWNIVANEGLLYSFIITYSPASLWQQLTSDKYNSYHTTFEIIKLFS